MFKTFNVHSMRVTTQAVRVTIQAVLFLYASVGLAIIVMDSWGGAS